MSATQQAGLFQQPATIAAVATGAGGGIGIVRISGPEALAIGDRIFAGRGGRPLAAVPPFRLTRGSVVAPASGETIDEVLAVRMPQGRSYTGEETVEIHAHGGPAVLDAVLAEALAAGARAARPGEFTKRAFLNGRIDLAQAEAIAELIAARTEAGRRRALRQLQGGAGERVRAISRELVECLAHGEAVIDFADEEGIAEPFPAPRVTEAARSIRGLLEADREGSSRPEGARVVFAGRPNTGKSSLFNKLTNMPRSIVTPDPGTTRDYVEERMVLAGVRVILTDTAGLREARDLAEAEGIRRSLERAGEADLVLLLIDGSEPADPRETAFSRGALGREVMVVVTKSDLPQRFDPATLAALAHPAALRRVSSLTGEGCDDLGRAIAERCRPRESPAEGGTPFNPRQRDALARAAGSLELALGDEGSQPTLDQALFEIRTALDALGEITGESSREEVLEQIFSRFCIGK